MVLFVFGLPGRFSEWCEAVVAGLAAHALGPTERLHADTLEQLALGAMRSSAARAVVGSHQPGGALRRALVEAGQHFIVALDDPGATLAELALERGIGLAADETPPAGDPEAWWRGLTDGERAMASGALAPYVAHGENPPLVWTADLF